MTDQSALSANQIESTTTILTKQKESLRKYAEADGRALDCVTMLDSVLEVLNSPFYPVAAETSPDGDENEGEDAEDAESAEEVADGDDGEGAPSRGVE